MIVCRRAAVPLLLSLFVIGLVWSAAAQPAVPTTPPIAFATNTPVPSPVPTIAPTSAFNPPPFTSPPPDVSPAEGWSCGDFPCADDTAGWLQRIRVPAGYTVEPVGRFPGQVMQIAYGRAGQLYATVLENGARSGAVYVLADGTVTRLSTPLISPYGIAVHPETGDLFVTARLSATQGGGVWRVPLGGGVPQPLVTDLPCCFQLIDNQPAGIAFGHDGALYVGVGSLTDRAEMPPRSARAYAEIVPGEAAVLRVDPVSGAWTIHADGIRFPADLAIAPAGGLFAVDSGLITGLGDRVLRIDSGGFYGWPYWTGRGCAECPPPSGRGRPLPDLLTLPPRSLPRGVAVYGGRMFPANQLGAIFVALWNATPDGQRVIRIDPARLPPNLSNGASDLGDPAAPNYAYEPFVTGLLRPADVVVAPDGALTIADYVLGLVWRVVFTGE